MLGISPITLRRAAFDAYLRPDRGPTGTEHRRYDAQRVYELAADRAHIQALIDSTRRNWRAE